MSAAELASAVSGAALVLLLPGPTNALLAAAGATGSGRPPIGLVLSCLSGYLISTNVLWLFAGLLSEVSPYLGPAIRIALAGYLVLLGCCLWRTAGSDDVDGGITPSRLFVTTLTNPKAAIFAFAMMPDAGLIPWLGWTAGFSVAVVAAGLSWLLLGHQVRRRAGDRAAAFVPRLASVALFGFAALLAARSLAALA